MPQHPRSPARSALPADRRHVVGGARRRRTTSLRLPDPGSSNWQDWRILGPSSEVRPLPREQGFGSSSMGRPTRWRGPGVRAVNGRYPRTARRHVRRIAQERSPREPRPTGRRGRPRRGRGHPDEVVDPQGPARRRRPHPGAPRGGSRRARSSPTTSWSSSATAGTQVTAHLAEVAPKAPPPSRTSSSAPATPSACALDGLPAADRHRGRHLRRRPAAHRRHPAPLLGRPRRAAATPSRSSPRRRRPDRLRPDRARRRRRRSQRIVEQKDATADAARDPRDQLGHLRLRRGSPARRPRPARHRQRAGRAVPHRRPAPSPAAPAAGSAPWSSTTSGRSRASTTGSSWPPCTASSTDVPVEAWMRAGVDRRRPRHHLDRRRRHPRARHPARAERPAARQHPRRRPAPSSDPTATSSTPGSAPARPSSNTTSRRRRHRSRGDRRARTPTSARAPGSAAARKAGGFVEMKKAELGDGAKVPHLSYVGDADHRRGRQHRRRHDLRQLRRRREAPHRRRRRTASSAATRCWSRR